MTVCVSGNIIIDEKGAKFMLNTEILRQAIERLNDQDVNFQEVVDYLYSHEYVDIDIMECFGGSLKNRQDREYRYVLNAFINLNTQAMYKLSTEYFALLSPFIFMEQRDETVEDYIESFRHGGIDFIDFMRMKTGIYPNAPAYYGMGRRDSFLPEDLSPIYDKLITLHEMYGLSAYDIINYCYFQTSSNASGKLFDLWFEYVVAIRPSDGLDIMPENLLFSYNALREKQGKEPLIYKLKEYSGGNFKLTRRGRNLVLVAALPFDATNNVVDFGHCKFWFDDVENIQITSLKEVASDNRTGTKYGKLFFEVDVKLTPNSLIMVDQDDVDIDFKPFTGTSGSSIHMSLNIGTTWVAYFEGASRLDIRENALSDIRKNTKLTQKEAASGVHSKTRTFQNWEAGKGSPSIESLIRLMYLYDFTDVRRFIERKYFFDQMDETFKSGKPLSEIFPRHYDALKSPDDDNDEEGGD